MWVAVHLVKSQAATHIGRQRDLKTHLGSRQKLSSRKTLNFSHLGQSSLERRLNTDRLHVFLSAHRLAAVCIDTKSVMVPNIRPFRIETISSRGRGLVTYIDIAESAHVTHERLLLTIQPEVDTKNPAMAIAFVSQ